MKTLMMLAGAAMLAAAPAVADPGKGQGKGKKNHPAMTQGKSGVGKSTVRGKVSHGIVTTDRYGRLYALNSRGTCPPGLAKRGNGCMPPGQAKKMYNVGQRYNRNFGNTWSYNQIPDYLRTRYNFGDDHRYYYNNGYIYQVDPRTMLVQQVVSALLR